MALTPTLTPTLTLPLYHVTQDGVAEPATRITAAGQAILLTAGADGADYVMYVPEENL